MEKYVLPLGLSVGFCKKNFYETIKKVKETGIEYIDFDIAGSWNRPAEEEIYYRDLEKGIAAVKELGLKVNGVHIAFGKRWDPSEKWSFRRKKMVKKIVDIIKRMDKCEPFCYVLHGSFEPISNRARKKKINALLASLPEICAATERYVCLENLPRTCLLNTAKECKEILDSADIKNLRICLDLNHFLKEKTEDAIPVLAGKIATLHVSDCDYKNERHWMPGEGSIDWNAVLDALKNAGYKGVFNYEIDNPSPQKIKENYQKLFADFNKENE